MHAANKPSLLPCYCSIHNVVTPERPVLRRHSMARLADVWIALLVCCWATRVSAASDRSESFIGYSESGAECQDSLQDCIPKARKNGCIYDPFSLRQFCPTTCAVERCSFRGSVEVKHRGHATAEGTQAYKVLMKTQYRMAQDHLRMVQIKPADEQLILSGLGVGTYLGDTDSRTDEAVVNAILFSVSHGWNVIDTASNYRWGRGELSVGTALSAMLAGDTSSAFAVFKEEFGSPTAQDKVATALKNEPNSEIIFELEAAGLTAVHQGGDITRDMVFISTKAGFTTPDLVNDLIKQRVMAFGDVVGGMHSLHPAYLKASLDQSLERLHVETVDLFYLHNAAEVQLPAVGRDKFIKRLLAAFQACEEMRADGKIQAYGLATWDCFRKPPGDPLYLGLADVVNLALEAGGVAHGFRFVQLPINVAMPEAWIEPWQSVYSRNTTFMEAAENLHVGVMTSGPLGEAELLESMEHHVAHVPELAACPSVASKLLQYARSVPGITTTLVGHKVRANVESNLQLSLRQPLDKKQFLAAHRGITGSRVRSVKATQQADLRQLDS